MNLYVLHEKMTAHLFPAYSNTDERFLTLALCGEAGELANLIKKRWRDDVNLVEEIRDEIADCRVYLELLAKCFNIEGGRLDALVASIPTITVSDERWLSLVLCSGTGQLAGHISGAWVFGEDAPLESCKDAVVGIRITLENLAIVFDIGGELLDQRVEQKLVKVVEKHKVRLNSQDHPGN